ncbi:hypothetical protein FQR65_LT20882 [Abscondita terminalis]|nr:hypothetical protein FQR65_LT20882 [Abscondita terminalis]
MKAAGAEPLGWWSGIQGAGFVNRAAVSGPRLLALVNMLLMAHPTSSSRSPRSTFIATRSSGQSFDVRPGGGRGPCLSSASDLFRAQGASCRARKQSRRQQARARNRLGVRPMSGENLLHKSSGLTKRFGGLQVFQDIQLRLAQGDVMGVIGPNGRPARRRCQRDQRKSSGAKTCRAKVLSRQGDDAASRSMRQPRRHLCALPADEHLPHRERPARTSPCPSTFSGGDSAAWTRVAPTARRVLSWRPAGRSRATSCPNGLRRMLGLVAPYVTSQGQSSGRTGGRTGRARARPHRPQFVRRAAGGPRLQRHDRRALTWTGSPAVVQHSPYWTPGGSFASGPPAGGARPQRIIEPMSAAVEDEAA